jgi:hypothetical protein
MSGSLRFSQFSGCWLILSVYILMSFVKAAPVYWFDARVNTLVVNWPCQIRLSDRRMTLNCKHNMGAVQIRCNVIHVCKSIDQITVSISDMITHLWKSSLMLSLPHYLCIPYLIWPDCKRYIVFGQRPCYAYSLMSYDGQIILSGMVSLQPMCLHEHQINILVLLWQLFYLFCSSIVINTFIVTAGNFEP